SPFNRSHAGHPTTGAVRKASQPDGGARRLSRSASVPTQPGGSFSGGSESCRRSGRRACAAQLGRRGLLGAAMVGNASWWPINAAQFVYVVSGSFPEAWTGFSRKAFASLCGFVRLSLV
uniref:Uncharacterized protein n=9 Tax=Aegilops tauschii subsp. strangulata TaxID=200361 RepID=A0A453ELU9_AEGTS